MFLAFLLLVAQFCQQAAMRKTRKSPEVIVKDQTDEQIELSGFCLVLFTRCSVMGKEKAT